MDNLDKGKKSLPANKMLIKFCILIVTLLITVFLAGVLSAFMAEPLNAQSSEAAPWNLPEAQSGKYAIIEVPLNNNGYANSLLLDLPEVLKSQNNYYKIRYAKLTVHQTYCWGLTEDTFLELKAYSYTKPFFGEDTWRLDPQAFDYLPAKAPQTPGEVVTYEFDLTYLMQFWYKHLLWGQA